MQQFIQISAKITALQLSTLVFLKSLSFQSLLELEWRAAKELWRIAWILGITVKSRFNEPLFWEILSIGVLLVNKEAEII